MAYGVTQQMIDTYGETVFKLSLNKQTRRGDAVRLLDFEAIEAARAETGLTDEEIAERIGLLPEQVSVVRVFTERKHHKIDQHRRIFHLGGGKRWKKEENGDLTLISSVPLKSKRVTFETEKGIQICNLTEIGETDGDYTYEKEFASFVDDEIVSCDGFSADDYDKRFKKVWI